QVKTTVSPVFGSRCRMASTMRPPTDTTTMLQIQRAKMAAIAAPTSARRFVLVCLRDLLIAGASLSHIQVVPAQQRQQHISIRGAHGRGAGHHRFHALIGPLDEEALVAGGD